MPHFGGQVTSFDEKNAMVGIRRSRPRPHGGVIGMAGAGKRLLPRVIRAVGVYNGRVPYRPEGFDADHVFQCC